MATVDVPWDWFVFRMKAYWHVVKVAKFELLAVYRFRTAEGRSSLWAHSAPRLLGLSNMTRSRGRSGQTIEIQPASIPFEWKFSCWLPLLDCLFLLKVIRFDPLAPVKTTALLKHVEWKMPDSISNNEYSEPICKN